MSVNLVSDVLSQPKDAIRYSMSRSLAAAFPEHYMLETGDASFDVEEFASDGLCELRGRQDIHSEWNDGWDGYRHRRYRVAKNTWHHVTWNGSPFELVTLTTVEGYCEEKRRYLLAPSQELADAFFAAVCEYNDEVRGEVLVFSDGHWSKSKDLYSSIAAASYADVVLADGLREVIRADFERFLGSRETYEQYGVPWKRGVIFLGPPGNGKTQMVKALANGLGVPVLYVRSFKSQHLGDHYCIDRAFSRARQTTPCLFVLEDLDSLVDSGNRSFFLNEMDGFAANTGILTLATANYPERLDPAILDRPSRFDRKYTFDLPGVGERQSYLKLWNARLERALKLSDDEITLVAEETPGFSYAYLKELVLSSMMAWIDSGANDRMAHTMSKVIPTLRQQMESGLEGPMAVIAADESEDDDA